MVMSLMVMETAVSIGALAIRGAVVSAFRSVVVMPLCTECGGVPGIEFRFLLAFAQIDICHC